MDINMLRNGDGAGMLNGIQAHADEHVRLTLHQVDTVVARIGATVIFGHGPQISLQAYPDTASAQLVYLQSVLAVRTHEARHLMAYVAQHQAPDLHNLLGSPVPDYPPAG